jgi:ribonuclease E
VRNALAQIAKSTVPHSESADPNESSSVEAQPLSGIVLTKAEEAAGAAAEAAVEILDIPVPLVRSSRTSRRISTQDAEEILGSVLGALPEPKPAGQGRSRGSRRVSTAGAVVTPSESHD